MKGHSVDAEWPQFFGELLPSAFAEWEPAKEEEPVRS